MNENIVEWLLEDKNPSVRYLTLTQLLHKPLDDIEVVKTKENIMKIGAVAEILEKQNDDGSFSEPTRFYRDKYKGTVWTLLLLAELCAEMSDDRVKKACEFILLNSQEIENGGFSIDVSKKTGCGLPRYVIPCLTGNMVFALIKFGYLEDMRVQKAIKWILKYQRTDDGDFLSPEGYHKSHPACFSKHSCHMGVAKSFKALIAIPKNKRTKEIKDKIDEFKKHFLIHHIYKKSHSLEQESKPGWKKFGFPLMYQTDILELVELFCELDSKDERLDDAIRIILEKQTKDGSWKLENSYNGKTIIDIEKKGQPSKWITFKALKILQSIE